MDAYKDHGSQQYYGSTTFQCLHARTVKILSVLVVCTVFNLYYSSDRYFERSRIAIVYEEVTQSTSSKITDFPAIENSTVVLSLNANYSRVKRNIGSEMDDADSSLTVREYFQKKVNRGDTVNIKAIKHLVFAYSNVQEMRDRSIRFPSVEQRVKLYMSNWYIPPCNEEAQIPYWYSNHSSLTVRELSIQQHDEEAAATDEVKVQSNHQQRFFVLDSYFDAQVDVSFDQIHYMDRQVIMKCSHKYCQDFREFFVPSLDRLLNNSSGTIVDNDLNIPILYQFGDRYVTRGRQTFSNNDTFTKYTRYPRVPVIQKVRTRTSPIDLQSITDDSKYPCYKKSERLASIKSNDSLYSRHPAQNDNFLQMEPIIIKLKTQRHYDRIYKVHHEDTIPWDAKKNVAVFRGALTGLYNNGITVAEATKLTTLGRCQLLTRCWFTYTHAQSTIIDSKLTEPYPKLDTIPRYMNQLDGANNSTTQIDLFGKIMAMNELLQYKALVLLEGNDVSSGLKWALFSNSIVMMPNPTLTSWAMEEMLIPWVHYVPINVYTKISNDTTTTSTYTDAEEKMQWIIDNDDKARQIAKASTLWIADLVLHPDAADDDRQIFDEIARRYITHFAPSSSEWLK